MRVQIGYNPTQTKDTDFSKTNLASKKFFSQYRGGERDIFPAIGRLKENDLMQPSVF